MDDISDRLDQLDWVLSGQEAMLTDKQLEERWQECAQWRDWYSLEFVAAEQEYRQWQKQTGGSRDEWHRIERKKLEKKP